MANWTQNWNANVIQVPGCVHSPVIQGFVNNGNQCLDGSSTFGFQTVNQVSLLFNNYSQSFGYVNLTKNLFNERLFTTDQNSITIYDATSTADEHQFTSKANGINININDIATSQWWNNTISPTGQPNILITPGQIGASITTDKTSYQRQDTITITVNNPTANKLYVTGYGPQGIMTDILWNAEVPAGITTTWNKIITDDYQLGNYQISAATTNGYTPIVAIAYFNIALPTNVSNKLGLLWDNFVYSTGQTGTIYAQSNFNASTLLITAPSGSTTTFNLIANQTRNIGITLKEDGFWQAKLTDNGNASNYLTANTSATSGRSNNGCDGSTISQPTYICWDKVEYFQGDSFILKYQITPKITDIASLYPFIEIENPDGILTVNKSINGSFQLNSNKYFGTLLGNFGTSATLGTYTARLININILGQTEIRGQAQTYLVQGNSTITPIPTPGTAGMSNQATNLLNIFTYMAFYGLVIFVGIFYSAIKLMTAHGAQVNGSALVIIMSVIATMEALIGLFDPFKIYIIVITWVFAAIYFRMNRQTAQGGGE